jgi:hypothetical protein
MWRPLDDDRLALLSRERIPSDGAICAGRISLDDRHATWDRLAQFFAPVPSPPRAEFGPFRFDIAQYVTAVEAAREHFEAVVLDPDRIERDEARAWLNRAVRRLRVVEGLLWAYEHGDFVRRTDPSETDPVLRARAFLRLVMASELRAEPVAAILAAFVDDGTAPERTELQAEHAHLCDEIARRVPSGSDGARVQIGRHGPRGVMGDLV